MDKELKIKAVSFKSRGVLIEHPKVWLRAAKEFDLKNIRVGQIQKLRLSESLDGEFIIHEVLE